MFHFFAGRRTRYTIITAILVLTGIIILIGIAGATGITYVIRNAKKAQAALLPAVEAAKISQYLYQNRIYTEEHMATVNRPQQQNLERVIRRNYKAIDSLMVQFEEQYSRQDGAENLLKYRNRLLKYRSYEQQTLRLSATGDKKQAQAVFLAQSVGAFQEVIEPINTLTSKYVRQGTLAYTQAERAAGYTKLALYGSIGFAFLTLLVLGTIIGYRYLNE